MKKKPSLLALFLLTLIGGIPLQGICTESDFTSLFDGKTLTGWKLIGKQGAGYYVKNGSIVCPPDGGGNLLSETQYKDFILRFEFKLAIGSNNGLAIRSPFQANNLAYDGIELQIIDNSAVRYRNIQPWQKHGSLYHVLPAKTGFLRPIGTWNTQEVVAKGNHIQVILNGHLILNANLDLVKDPEILAQHPGLMRPFGHIGFLGHGEPIEIRRIRIKVLNAD